MKTIIASSEDYVPTNKDYEFLDSQNITEVICARDPWKSWALLNGIPVILDETAPIEIMVETADRAILFPENCHTTEVIYRELMDYPVPFYDLRGGGACH